MKLIERLDEITPAWLTEVLASRFPGVQVSSIDLVEVIAATATKARLKVRYDDRANAVDAPEHIVVKGGLVGHPHEAAIAPLYRNETIFYRDVAPKLRVELPACYAAIADGNNGLVLLEDLTDRNARYGAGRVPLSVDAAAETLTYQASYHARFWGRGSDLHELELMNLDGFLQSFFSGLSSHFVIETHAHHDRTAVEAVTAAKQMLTDRGRFATAVHAVWAHNAATAPCLIHFDPHPGNMYFTPDGAPHYLDWQLCGNGGWAWDVATL